MFNYQSTRNKFLNAPLFKSSVAQMWNEDQRCYSCSALLYCTLKTTTMYIKREVRSKKVSKIHPLHCTVSRWRCVLPPTTVVAFANNINWNGTWYVDWKGHCSCKWWWIVTVCTVWILEAWNWRLVLWIWMAMMCYSKSKGKCKWCNVLDGVVFVRCHMISRLWGSFANRTNSNAAMRSTSNIYCKRCSTRYVCTGCWSWRRLCLL